MTHAREHHLVYHYADGVADILGLSTAQQLAIRTAMHLALREMAAGYEATAADMATQIELLRNELQEAESRQEQAESERLAPLLATISVNGTERSSISTAPIRNQVEQHAVTFVPAAAEEAATEPQQDPTPAAAADRKPFAFRWPTLDDKSLEIVRQLDGGQIAWRTLDREDKRIIVLAAISELHLGMLLGETLGLMEFDRRRPIWMSGFSSITQSLGRTWTQLLDAATRV